MNNQKKDRIFLLIAFFLPLVVSGVFRFWDLDLRPFHSDEGVNSHFLLKLYKDNYYHYNPANYHGPFLYYIGLIPFYILGINDFSFRIMPALFGIMNVALLYPLRRKLGTMGLLAAGLMVAISPSISFFARDTIHETYLIFFTLAVVVSFYLYYETRKARHIYFASASLAFVVTIKETFIVTFAVFALALAIAYFCQITFFTKGPWFQALKDVFRSLGGQFRRRKYTIIISFAMFLLINFLFYSSFFTYYDGVKGILTTLMIWTKTGTKESGGHVKPFIYYFKILYKFELPILVVAIVGYYFVVREKRKFSIFVASWTLLIFLIYSLIPYKTPWLIINVTLPLAIMGGIFFNGIFSFVKKGWHQAVFYPLTVCLFGVLCYNSILLNFVYYDDERRELVYVQTHRDIYNLLDSMDALAEKGGKDMVINVVSKSYWPLPWYLRRRGFTKPKFWGKVIKNPNAPVILADRKGEPELKKKLKGVYKTKNFILRPGVWMFAYIQKDLYEAVYGREGEVEAEEYVPIVKVSRDELEPGLIANYFHNAECAGEPFLTKMETGQISFEYRDKSKRPYRTPFGIRWEGYLFIEEEGVYQFATKSDDGSNVYVDGYIVVDNSGLHATRHVAAAVFMDEGFHKFKVDYFEGGGAAIMNLLWTPQGGKETLIPGDRFFHKK